MWTADTMPITRTFGLLSRRKHGLRDGGGQDETELRLFHNGVATTIELANVAQLRSSKGPGSRCLIDVVLVSGQRVRVEGLEDMEEFERELRERINAVRATGK